MDRPRLQFERSVALHAAVAARLRDDPSVLIRAKRKLTEWLHAGGASAPLWREWAAILEKPTPEIAAAMTDRSEHAAWLRTASPFAGILSETERQQILRDVRKQLEA